MIHTHTHTKQSFNFIHAQRWKHSTTGHNLEFYTEHNANTRMVLHLSPEAKPNENVNNEKEKRKHYSCVAWAKVPHGTVAEAAVATIRSFCNSLQLNSDDDANADFCLDLYETFHRIHTGNCIEA